MFFIKDKRNNIAGLVFNGGICFNAIDNCPNVLHRLRVRLRLAFDKKWMDLLFMHWTPFEVFGDIPVWSYVKVVNWSFILELISVLGKVALYIMHHYWWSILCWRMLSLSSFTFLIFSTILDCVWNCLSFRPWNSYV